MIRYRCCCCWHFLRYTASTWSVYSTFFFCDINDILGAITLGDATIIGTLGDGTVIGNLRSATEVTPLGTNFALGFFGCYSCCGCMLLNSVASLSIEYNWLSPIVEGVLGPVFFNTCINSLYAMVDCYVVDNPGMIRCCVNNSGTSACISPIVFGIYLV